MPYTPTAFQPLLEPLDRRVIARAVAAHDGDRGVGRGDNAWTCERHLKSLLFAQLAGLTSLRQIVTGLGAHSRWFYHLNLRAPRRSTLADAHAERPAAVFRDIALALIPVAAGARRGDSEALIRLLDSTPIPLKGDGFPWAEANPRTRRLKLHLLDDSRQRRPVWFELTSAKIGARSSSPAPTTNSRFTCSPTTSRAPPPTSRSSTKSAGRSSCCSSGSSRTSRSAAFSVAAKTPCAPRSMSR